MIHATLEFLGDKIICRDEMWIASVAEVLENNL